MKPIKKFPDWALKTSAEEASAILEGLRNSDGSNKRNTWVYDTTSQSVADTLQALLHINGKTGSISYRKTPTGFCIRINVSNRIHPRVEVNQSGRSLTYSDEFVHYNGTVHCVTVTTGAVLVRRNGKVVVSGNSPFEHQACAIDPVLAGGFYYGCYRNWKPYRKFFPGENKTADLHALLASKPDWISLNDEAGNSH